MPSLLPGHHKHLPEGLTNIYRHGSKQSA